MLPAIHHTLINRNYTLFMLGSFVSALGSWFQAVAIGWLVLELSGSPFVLGLANFAQMAPLFFLGFFGGVLADRVDRRFLLIGGIGLGTIATTVIAVLSLVDRQSITALLLASLVLGLSNAVVWPAWQPFITDLVPKDRLRDAMAFNSARFNLSRVLGPALAGVLMPPAGAPICLLLPPVSRAAVLIATWLIRLPAARRAHGPRRRPHLPPPRRRLQRRRHDRHLAHPPPRRPPCPQPPLVLRPRRRRPLRPRRRLHHPDAARHRPLRHPRPALPGLPPR